MANDANEAACVELSEGDDCVRGDGDAGTCLPDDSDPDVLTCEDGPGTDEDGGGVSDDNGSDFDTLACEGLEEGELCLREDGEEGTCTPDESDAGQLECEDESGTPGTPGMDDGSGGVELPSLSCSVVWDAPAPAWMGLLMLFGLLRRRR